MPKTQRRGGRLLSIFILAAIGVAPTLRATAYLQTSFQLEDRAVLVTIDEGIRRVRLQTLDPQTGAWKVVTVAHLDGRAGYMKLRLPDGLPMENLRCEISRTDPFPASFYQGSTTFSDTADKSNPSQRFGSPAKPQDNTTTEADSVASVVESDIWKWKDRTLYFFNTYRGLQVLDLTDPSDPQRVASLRMPAVGEEMYLAGENHVVLLANNGAGWYGNGAVKSEIVLVRHADEELAVTHRFEVEGSFVESRMVGDLLYAVTRFWEQFPDADGIWQVRAGLNVHKLDLTDPANPILGKSLELKGDVNSDFYYNAVVTATPDHLFVIPTTWDSVTSNRRSEVHIIDISNPDAPLKVRGRIQLQGMLNDKFKLRERDGILTTITQSSRNATAASLTTIENFDLTSVDTESPPLLGAVTLAPRETVRATRFDEDRVYVVTFLWIDPLYVVDLSDPGRPTLLGELDVPGWSTYLEPIGDRLLSVGVEDRRVAVSLFDVGDPTNPFMLDRVYLGSEEGYSWSEANYDEKAIGYFPDEGLLVLPFSTYANDDYQTRMQFIDVDRDSLTRRGQIESEFSGRRSKLFDSSLVAVSGRELQIVDVGNRDQPEWINRLSLAWPVDAVAAIGKDHLAQFENGYWGWSNGKSKPIIMRISRSDDVETVVAELPIGDGDQVAGVVGRGHQIFLLTARPIAYQRDLGMGRTIWEFETAYRTIVIDVENPEEPNLLGSTDSTIGAYSYWRQSKGHFLPGGELLWAPDISGVGGPIWGYPAIDMFPGIRAGDIWWPYTGSSEGIVLVTRIDDPTRPDVIAAIPLIEPDDPTDTYRETGPVLFDSDRLIFGYREGRWTEDRYEYAAFVREISFSEPSQPRRSKAVNVPGLLQHVLFTESGGDVLFTTRQKIEFDEVYDYSFWSADAVLEASVYDGLNAYLVDQVEITDGAYSTFSGYDRFLFRPKDNRWWSVEETDRGIQSFEWNLTSGRFQETQEIVLDTSPQSLIRNGDLLFAFGLGGVDAIAIHELPSEPSIRSLKAAAIGFSWGARTVELNRDETVAWIPVGVYGVESLDISGLARAMEVRSFARDEPQEWQPIDLFNRHVVPSTAADFVGVVPANRGWQYQPAATPVSYEVWSASHFNPEAIPDQKLPLPSDDTDHDGWSNAAEYALGTNPVDPDSAPRPRIQMSRNRSEGKQTLTCTYTLDPSTSGIVIGPESSADLVTWSPIVPSDDVAIVDDGWIVSLRFSRAVADARKQFVRLRFDVADSQ